MDLGTVSARLGGGGYASVAELASDVSLIWENAMKYNQDGSWVFKVSVIVGVSHTKDQIRPGWNRPKETKPTHYASRSQRENRARAR